MRLWEGLCVCVCAVCAVSGTRHRAARRAARGQGSRRSSRAWHVSKRTRGCSCDSSYRSSGVPRSYAGRARLLSHSCAEAMIAAPAAFGGARGYMVVLRDFIVMPGSHEVDSRRLWLSWPPRGVAARMRPHSLLGSLFIAPQHANRRARARGSRAHWGQCAELCRIPGGEDAPRASPGRP